MIGSGCARRVALYLFCFFVCGCGSSRSTEDRIADSFRERRDAFEQAKMVIERNDWKKPYGDEWSRIVDRLRSDDPRVLVVEPRKPFIHFELVTGNLDLNQAIVLVPEGSSIADYLRAKEAPGAISGQKKLADEWFWIMY